MHKMKSMKKLLAFALILVMLTALSATVFAAGSNTISVSGAINGETYSIYKLLDLSVNDETNPTAYSYTINSTWAGFWTTGAGKDYITTKTVGSVTYVEWKPDKKTAEDMEAFGKAAAAWAAANNITPTKPAVVAANDTAEWTGLDNGYYLVTSTYGTLVSVASTPANPQQSILEKNEENDTEKEVLEDSTENYDDENDAQIGDTITFRSKVSIVKNSINVVYHDTMTDGLTWDGATATAVYTDEACTTALAATNYTVAAGTGGETFTVTFTNAYIATLTADTDLYVKYTATLNDNAVVEDPETNTPSVTWGNAGISTGEPTETQTHQFQILKYDGSDSGKDPLDGAKFQLFTAETGGTALNLAVNAAGTVYRVYADDTKLPTGFTKTTDNKIVTIEDEKITVEGVDSDTYWLEETDAPEGFNKIDGRIEVVVNADNSLIVEIPNHAGTVLPSTGGIGTTLFYVIGAILVLGAGVVLVTKRRVRE